MLRDARQILLSKGDKVLVNWSGPLEGEVIDEVPVLDGPQNQPPIRKLVVNCKVILNVSLAGPPVIPFVWLLPPREKEENKND